MSAAPGEAGAAILVATLAGAILLVLTLFQLFFRQPLALVLLETLALMAGILLLTVLGLLAAFLLRKERDED